ncbi:MAG: hypothetical protein MJK04_37605 [Psychrosphaera sp.]|nr:hypothetical protein [Psychrosphaera sp.]
MLSIVLSELSRYKKLIVGLALLQFVFVLFITNVQWFMEAFVGIYHLILVLNLVFGAGLGWFQMRSLTKTNRWSFMIHRPLSQAKLFGGFTLGALAVFCLATLLPLLCSFIVVDLNNHGVVDWRLYLILPAIAVLLMCCYFAAAFAVLSPSKLAPLVFVLPACLISTKAHGLWVFVTMLVVLVWLAFICYKAFKPALDAHITQPTATALIALPIVYLLSFVLAYACNTVLQLGLILTDPKHTGSWSTYWPEDSFHYVEQMTERELLDYGLAHSKIYTAEPVVTQASNIEFNQFYVEWFKPVVRHQLLYMDGAYDYVSKIRDEVQGINWYFNHGEMLFFGIHDRSAQFKGWMDKSGEVHQSKQSISDAQRFTNIVRSIDNTEIYVGNQGFVYEGSVSKGLVNEGNRLFNTLTVGEDESFVAPLLLLNGSNWAALTDKFWYLLDKSADGQLKTLAKVPLNANLSNLSRMSMASFDGQYYLSILSGTQQRFNFADANHAFYRVNASTGEVTHLSTKALAVNWADGFRYRQYIVSPTMGYFHELLWSVLKPYQNPNLSVKKILTQPMPTNVLWGMLLVSILSMAITSWFVRPLLWSDRRKFGWIIVNGLTGIPGLVSLFFLNHIHKPPD